MATRNKNAQAAIAETTAALADMPTPATGSALPVETVKPIDAAPVSEQLPPPPEEVSIPVEPAEPAPEPLPLLVNGKKRPDVSADIVGDVLTITFGDTRQIILDSAKLDESIRLHALMHGLKQKTIDAGAIPRDTVTGRSPSINDKYDAIKEVVDRITGPTPAWNKIRDGGVSSANELLARALAEMSGKPKDTMLKMVEVATKEELAVLRKHPNVAKILLRMQTENVQTTGIDSDALLGKFMS